jgi:predicted acylesterase/phospholipase RssA
MRALVLSGGASKGQYLIGAMDYLLTEKKIKYDAFCGISIGAILSGYAAQYPKGQEDELICNLKELSLSLETSDVHKRWFLGYITALWKTGARSSKPLRNLISENIDEIKIRESGRLLRVGATKLGSTTDSPFRIFTENSPYIIEAIMASCALSPVLEAVKINDEWYVDGAFQYPLPLKSAIELGATEIDIVMCYPSTTNSFSYGKRLNTLEVIKREVELVIHKLAWDDVKQTNYVNDLVLSGLASTKKYVKLNIIKPKQDLVVDSLKFREEDAIRLQQQGFEDAKEYFSL